jgi:hypothetical protein
MVVAGNILTAPAVVVAGAVPGAVAVVVAEGVARAVAVVVAVGLIRAVAVVVAQHLAGPVAVVVAIAIALVGRAVVVATRRGRHRWRRLRRLGGLHWLGRLGEAWRLGVLDDTDREPRPLGPVRGVMMPPAVVVPAPAMVAPGGMSFIAALTEAGRGRRPCVGVGEVSPPPGHVRVSPVDVVTGVGLTQGHPAQRQQRHQGCQNESAPLLSRRSSVHCVRAAPRIPVECRP